MDQPWAISTPTSCFICVRADLPNPRLARRWCSHFSKRSSQKSHMSFFKNEFGTMFTGKYNSSCFHFPNRATQLGLVLVFICSSIVCRAQPAGTVAPSVTDPAITIYNNVHTWAIPATTSPRNKLFVFLPGTGGIPFVYQQIIRSAATNGFHSVGLMYVNPTYPLWRPAPSVLTRTVIKT